MDIKLTKESRDALKLMEKTHEHIFLTGRAGTGKSTLLQLFREKTEKKTVVLAPTGVAAVNVRGQTIHSFFGFGVDITPETAQRRHGKKGIFKKLQTIVIDEISMVRADLLDCVDIFLRANGPDPNQPFGGVQMIMIGDLYQLPPVLRREDTEMFTKRYPGAYFFDSKVFQNIQIRYIELTQVWRQQDPAFVALLDVIRTNTATSAALERINDRCKPPNETTAGESMVVHLTTTNAMADDINSRHLSRLPTPRVRVRGRLFGDFPEKQTPAANEINLKEGAQVMLVNNDPSARWVNGDIGKIIRIETGPESMIQVELANGKTHRLRPHTWEYIKFVYDEIDDKIEPKTIGSFTQYPVRLAWAITIHKGQGKTYDQVIVDFGRGTFAHGQAYVALSRATSLEGLTLKRPLREEDIFVDPRIEEFLRSFG